MVKDKINYRATGKRNFLTRQTNQGRANDGGLKIGEMERDGIMAHGLSYFLNESYMVRGDQYYMAVCNKTGTIAVYNPERNLFLSPFADGPLVFNRNVEGKDILDAVSKFGRSFSLLRIPFALKLLIQELQVMNIQMRIITEDNIDQLTNLSYQSRNIDKLLHINSGDVASDIKEVVENYRVQLTNKSSIGNASYPLSLPSTKYGSDVEHQEFTPPNEEEPANTTSPSYVPEEQDLANATSPPYVPEEQQQEPANATSPPYVPEEQQQEPLIESQQMESSSPVQQSAGSKLFDDPKMNDIFNRLSNDKQGAILQMPRHQQDAVMERIMVQAAGRTTNKGLEPYFNALPIEKQLTALQNGYKSMSSEFSKLSEKIPSSPLTTIKTPELVQDELTKRLPLLATTGGGGGTATVTGTKKDDNAQIYESNSNSNSESSSSSSSSSPSSDTKKIII